MIIKENLGQIESYLAMEIFAKNHSKRPGYRVFDLWDTNPGGGLACEIKYACVLGALSRLKQNAHHHF